jgi:hypothetical protein
MSTGLTCRAKISRKAAVSVVLAMLSLCLWAFTKIPALPVGVACLVLAILALRDIRRSQAELRGRQLARGSIAIELAGMLSFLVMVPAVQRVREAAQRSVSS